MNLTTLRLVATPSGFEPGDLESFLSLLKAGKYLEGIQSEPCPVGACCQATGLIIYLFNIFFKCHSVTTITIQDCRCAKKLKGQLGLSISSRAREENYA